MMQKIIGWQLLCGLTLMSVMLSAGGEESSGQKGNGGMLFGLFGGKKAAKTGTVVAAELGGSWQAATSVPAKFPAAILPAFADCNQAYYRGTPPDASWAPEHIAGETRRAFRIPASAGQAPLAILSSVGKQKHLQVWELSNDAAARFVKQRSITLEVAKEGVSDYPVMVTCLPGQLVALSVGHGVPSVETLFVYNPANNQFRRIEQLEPEMSTPPPFKSFETLIASPQAKLLLYHTGVIRLGAENYVYEYDHVLLFSPKYPQGLEILKLGIDDGNIRAWSMQGQKLWLQTEDRRKRPVSFNWTLDLSKVL